MASIDQLVDRFVASVNTGYREPISVDPDEVFYPPSVLVGWADEYGACDWAIKPYAGVDWIEPVEQRLGRRFPAVYRSLVTRYIFPSFEAGEILFFANTPEGTEFHELRNRIFSEDLYPALHRVGYLQIGIPEEGNYDPICLALPRGDSDDCPLVQVDHEGILIHGLIRVVREVAPSLRQLMQTVIEAGGA